MTYAIAITRYRQPLDEVPDRVRDGDPYVRRGMAQYELLPWTPGLGKESLDRL